MISHRPRNKENKVHIWNFYFSLATTNNTCFQNCPVVQQAQTVVVNHKGTASNLPEKEGCFESAFLGDKNQTKMLFLFIYRYPTKKIKVGSVQRSKDLATPSTTN